MNTLGVFEKEQEVGLHSWNRSVVRIEVRKDGGGQGEAKPYKVLTLYPRLISISPLKFYSTVKNKPGISRCGKGSPAISFKKLGFLAWWNQSPPQ